MFSNIAQQLHSETNSLYRLRDELAGQGYAIQDLISGNINEQGYLFPQELLEEILVQALRCCKIYRPDSFGRRSAREAVAEFYRKCGFHLDPESILITPGTSISYWYCFKLLADPGDEILCPCPSYPLFGYIAALSGVSLIPYPLDESHSWEIDIDRMEACVSAKTRALILISPHNPTGHVASSQEITQMAELANRHDLAIISDEVFSEFLLQKEVLPRMIGSSAPLVFTLNGFSKMFALPGIKFGWMAVSGRMERVQKAMRALELISDTFLPVNEAVQAAAPEIFRRGQPIKNEFALCIRNCWQMAEAHLAQSSHCKYTKPDGGFYITLRLVERDETQTADSILRENHILVHPGYFYDMDADHLVLSFVQKPEIIEDSYPKLLKTIDKEGYE